MSAVLHAGIISLVLAATLAGPANASAAEIYIGVPTVGGHRVDICLDWGMQCDGEAAQEWCRAQGYTRALEWEVDHDIGAQHPTRVIGSGQVCAEVHCDGYFSISCAREDAWTQSTGHGGLLVEVNRHSQQSPEGLLVVAVSEQDQSHATAAAVDLNKLALLHTPPGKWRVFVLNFSNPQSIMPPPGEAVEVPAGKDGGYLAVTVD